MIPYYAARERQRAAGISGTGISPILVHRLRPPIAEPEPAPMRFDLEARRAFLQRSVDERAAALVPLVDKLEQLAKTARTKEQIRFLRYALDWAKAMMRGNEHEAHRIERQLEHLRGVGGS